MSTQTHITSVQAGISHRWLNVLDEKQINFMVLDPIHDRILIEQLQICPDWIIDFASEEAVIFMRQELSFHNFCQL